MGRKADNIKKILVKTASGEYKEVKNLYYHNGANILPVENAYTKINNGGYSSYLQFWTTDPPPDPVYDHVVNLTMTEVTTAYVHEQNIAIPDGKTVTVQTRSYRSFDITSSDESATYSISSGMNLFPPLNVVTHSPGHYTEYGIKFVFAGEESTEWYHPGCETEIANPLKGIIAPDLYSYAYVTLIGDQTTSDIVGFTIGNITTQESITLFATGTYSTMFDITSYGSWTSTDFLAFKSLMKSAYENEHLIGIKARYSYEFNA